MEPHSPPSKLPHQPDLDRERESISLSGSWHFDENSASYHYSDGAAVLLELDSKRESENPTLAECLHPDDRQAWIEAFVTRETDPQTSRFTARVLGPNNSIRHLEISWRRKGDTAYGTVCDITRHLRHVEESLQSARVQLSAIDELPIRVFWKDLESNYLGCNYAFAQDAGLKSPQEVVGKTDYDLFEQGDAEYFRKIDQEVMTSGEAQEQFVEPQSRSDGSQAWLRTSKVPLRRNNGEVFGILGTYENITEHKERERRFELTHYSVDKMKSAIFWCNADGSFFYANQIACKWLQYEHDELLNLSVPDVRLNCPPEAWSDHWNELKSAGALEAITEHKRKDGSRYPVEIHSNYVNVDGHEFEIAFVFDITDRQTAENKIQEYQHNLEKLVEIRTKELRETNKELESFAYSVSHDLRAPLRGIDGFSQALLEDYEEAFDEQAKHYLNRIRTGTQKMSSLIDDILQLSRISRKELVKESVDISSLLGEIFSDLQESDPERSVEVSIEPNLEIHCDADLVRIAFQNLLENAWKYTSKRETARIRITTQQFDESRVFCIEDNGAGFDMNYAAKLFAPFQRLHRQDEYAGNGIGLATVQRIASKHSGSVWAESTPDAGSRFYLRIPELDPSSTPSNS